MIESLHRAPCAAHMLLSMVAQSIVTVGHFFPRTARRTVPGIRSQVTVKLHGTFSRKRQNNGKRESETSSTEGIRSLIVHGAWPPGLAAHSRNGRRLRATPPYAPQMQQPGDDGRLQLRDQQTPTVRA